MEKLLAGLKLLDVGTMTPGKYCSYLLADLGADVVRIERPMSDPGPVDDEDLVLNQGKRSITLNLRSEAGTNLLLRLAEDADVILESNRPGTADRNGYGWAAVKELNPRLIYCALSGYGATGPLSQAPGYDLIFAAQSGMLRALTGRQVPVLPEAYLADGVAGLTAAYAIVAALLGRERGGSSGKGAYIDLAMHDSIFGLLAVSHGLKRQDAQAAREAVQATPTYDLYEARDHTFVALGAFRRASAQALFEKLGRPELADGANADEVKSFLAETFMSAPAQTWVVELAPLDIEISCANDPMQAYDDPQLKARGMISSSIHPEAGAIETIQPPLRFTQSSEVEALAPAQRIGADTDAILKSLGLDEPSIAELRGNGII